MALVVRFKLRSFSLDVRFKLRSFGMDPIRLSTDQSSLFVVRFKIWSWRIRARSLSSTDQSSLFVVRSVQALGVARVAAPSIDRSYKYWLLGDGTRLSTDGTLLSADGTPAPCCRRTDHVLFTVSQIFLFLYHYHLFVFRSKFILFPTSYSIHIPVCWTANLLFQFPTPYAYSLQITGIT